jgi:hypothetical protein
MKAIAEDFGIDRKTVYNVARRAGLPNRHVFDPERTKRILAADEAGVPITQIAETEGVHRTYVRDVAKRAGLPPREGWARMYPLDETAFEEPTPVDWWLVGLLAADGCVRTGNLISLAQSERDADVLREFLEYVGCPDRPLTELKLSSGAARRACPPVRYMGPRPTRVAKILWASTGLSKETPQFGGTFLPLMKRPTVNAAANENI